MTYHPLTENIPEKIVGHVGSDNMSVFYNREILITGGSGLFGKWLIQSILFANKHRGANIKITSITRNKANVPMFLIDSDIEWIEQDIINPIKTDKEFDYIFHLATDADKDRYDYAKFVQEIIVGTQNVLDLSSEKTRILLTSSGAVYGQMPDYPVDEEYQGKIDINSPHSFYAEAKRISEMLLINHKNKKSGIIARCFAFYGDYISKKYAISSFIEKAKNDQDIVINNPDAVRSYMSMQDLTIWLLRLINLDDGDIYNVGSDEQITILDLAEKIVKKYSSSSKIIVNKVNDNKQTRSFYIPNLGKAKRLNLTLTSIWKE